MEVWWGGRVGAVKVLKGGDELVAGGAVEERWELWRRNCGDMVRNIVGPQWSISIILVGFGNGSGRGLVGSWRSSGGLVGI